MTTRHTGHVKRLAAPIKYPLLRKETKYTVKIHGGPHNLTNSVPLLLVLRDILKYAKNQKEVKAVLNENSVYIDGKIRKDIRLPIGLMDVVSIRKTGENFRILFGQNGKVKLVKINDHESKVKLCKILNKTIIKKGKIQLNLHDGRNIIVDKGHYKTGDSVLISVPEQEIKKHVAIEKGVKVYIMDGTHIGELAVLHDFKPQGGSQPDRVILTTEGGETFETLEEYIFVLGKEKPEIAIEGER